MGDDEALIAAPLPNQHMARFRLEFRSHVRVAEPDAPEFSTYAWPVGINLAADADRAMGAVNPTRFLQLLDHGYLAARGARTAGPVGRLDHPELIP